ncbi:MAG TPA: hypothetical protein VGB30_07110 [bacterium]
MDIDLKVVDSNPVLDVSIKTVSFLDQHDFIFKIGIKEFQHPAEHRTSRLFCSLDLNEFLQYIKIAICCILPQQPKLSVDGVPL